MTRFDQLLDDVLTSIEAVHGEYSTTDEPSTINLYWRIGKRINEEKGKRKDAKKTAQNIHKLAENLGSEFSTNALTQMAQFAERFPDYKAVISMSKTLSWEHFKLLIALDDDLKRNFYAWMCFVKKWSLRTLSSKIDSALYEKTPASERKGDYDELLTSELIDRNAGLLHWLGLSNR